MDEATLTKIVLENAKHLLVVNRELGGLLAATSLHTKLIIGQFVFLGTIFLTNLLHLKITRKNGNNERKN